MIVLDAELNELACREKLDSKAIAVLAGRFGPEGPILITRSSVLAPFSYRAHIAIDTIEALGAYVHGARSKDPDGVGGMRCYIQTVRDVKHKIRAGGLSCPPKKGGRS
ncbi:MAG: hypothetical protein VYA51_12880 [Planctomycetota bacterium]|nr:hypothetical protein [Planctomycetota bacterium]